MSFNYAKSKATARKLLAKFGQSMTLTQIVHGTYDETTGTATDTTLDTTDTGVILPYSDGVSSMPDSLVLRGDQQILIQMAVVPKPTDKISANGTVYTIINVSALEPAGTNVLYTLQVRK